MIAGPPLTIPIVIDGHNVEVGESYFGSFTEGTMTSCDHLTNGIYKVGYGIKIEERQPWDHEKHPRNRAERRALGGAKRRRGMLR